MNLVPDPPVRLCIHCEHEMEAGGSRAFRATITFLCVHRFSGDSTLIRLPRDIVRVIARMVYDSQDDPCWYPMDLQLKLRNTTDDALKSPLVVRFAQNCFFEAIELNIQEEISVNGLIQRDFQVFVRPPGASTFDLPEMLEYELVYNGYTWKGSFEFDTGFLRGEFFTDDRYNILPFGPVGDGKSSSINSMLTCLMRGEIVADFAVANLLDLVTTRFTFQEASKILRKKGETNVERLPFVFYDIWGTEHPDIQEFLQFFPAIVRGKIPLHTHRDKLQDVDATQPNLDHEIHCLVLVVQIAQYLHPATMQELVDVTKQWISLDDRVGPVVLVTGIDKVEDPKTLETHKQKMMAALPVSANVFFIQNYTNHERKNVKIDMQMRRVLLAIRNNARVNKAKIDRSRARLRTAPGLGWESFVPTTAVAVAELLPKLGKSDLLPDDFSGSTQEEIIDFLRANLDVHKIHARAVARMLLAHFKN